MRPLLWATLIVEAEDYRARTGMGLASVWAHINARDYWAARAELDRVLSTPAAAIDGTREMEA